MTSKDRLQIVPDLPIDIPCPPCKPPKAPEQPDALARLEAWLAAGKNRECTIEFVVYGSALREWEVELSAGDGTVNRVGVGIAATIIAALEKAEKVER